MTIKFEYPTAKVRDLRLEHTRAPKTGKCHVKSIYVNGQEAQPTPRFWRSFFARFGLADNVFRYFEPEEVFNRVSDRVGADTIRVCLERQPEGPPQVLAVSNPAKPIITYGEVEDLVKRHGGEDLRYEGGLVTSTHAPPSGDRTFEIGGDKFQHRFVMETPIDGFSHPKIFLSFLRLLCTNGAIGYTQAFRSDISLGKDMHHCITRALASYDNGDGYAALRQRFGSAQTSWASVRECVTLYKDILKLQEKKAITKPTVLEDLTRVSGNLNQIYGLANLDALSLKRQRVLPARCRVYDLLNFASEVATHHATPLGNRGMQSYIGTLISDEYDMEGAAEAVSEFNDFFLDAPEGAPRPSVN